jgi:hypothetical protein
MEKQIEELKLEYDLRLRNKEAALKMKDDVIRAKDKAIEQFYLTQEHLWKYMETLEASNEYAWGKLKELHETVYGAMAK